MKQTNLFIFLLLCVGIFRLPVAAQAKSSSVTSADQRVARSLKQIKTDYEVDNDGIYRVIYKIDEKRSQSAYVISATDKIYDIEMRIVFSHAAASKTPFSSELMTRLLEENMMRSSAWAIVKADDGGFIIVNTVFVPADADGKRLDAAIQSVMSAADELEAQLSKEDKF